jgi:hypothetical protein
MFTHPDDLLRMHHQRAEELHRKAELRRLARAGRASTPGRLPHRAGISRAGRLVLDIWAKTLRRQSPGSALEPADTRPSNARAATPQSLAPKAEVTSAGAGTLGEAVAADGFDANWSTLTSLLLDARRHGVDEILIEVVADPTSPSVARERALGKILTAMWRDQDAPVQSTDQCMTILKTNIAS